MGKEEATISIRRCQLLRFSCCEASRISIDRLANLFTLLGLRVEHFTEGHIGILELKALEQSLALPKGVSKSSVLLICGGYLEEQVSVATTFFLACGYDVLLLRDLIESKTPAYYQIHDHRLLQAGAVSTTTQQLFYEWLATETDVETRERLSSLTLP